MIKPISQKIREEIDNEPFYRNCCLRFENFGYCEGRVEIHHNLIYAGKRSDEKWTLLPLCKKHHDMEKKKEVKEALNKVMVGLATPEELEAVSKVVNYKKYL